jgi:hypothetical protein
VSTRLLRRPFFSDPSGDHLGSLHPMSDRLPRYGTFLCGCALDTGWCSEAARRRLTKDWARDNNNGETETLLSDVRLYISNGSLLLSSTWGYMSLTVLNTETRRFRYSCRGFGLGCLNLVSSPDLTTGLAQLIACTCWELAPLLRSRAPDWIPW